MNSGYPFEFQKLAPGSDDLRAPYQLSIMKIARTLYRRRVVILCILIGSIAAALAVGKSMTRHYLGEALVQLKFDGTPGLASGSSGAPAVALSASSVVEGEAEIIRSRTIARRVAERDPQTSSATSAATAESESALPFVTALKETLSAAKRMVSSGSDGGLGPTERRIVELQSGLAVRNDGKTYLLKIDYTATDPVVAASLANAFAEEYLASRIEVSFNSAKRTSDWFALQVRDAGQIARNAEAAVHEFRTRTGVLAATNGEIAAPEQQLRDLVSQLSNARLDRLRLQGKLQRLQSSIADGRLPSAADLQSSISAQRLIDAQVQAQQEADRIVASLGERHPLYARARATLEDAQRQLDEAVGKTVAIVQAELTSAQASERTLEGQMTAFEQASTRDRVNAKTLAQLEGDAANARANLERLQESYRQASAVADLKPIAAELVSAAEPLRIPVAPKMNIILALGCVAGVAASLAAVFLLELRDRGYTSGPDASEDLGVPCAGIIPGLGRRCTAVAQEVHDRSIKSLVVNAGLLGSRAEHTVVIVTSAVPGEGKSDLVRALATCLAQADRRVLIVENAAGACRPTQHADDEAAAFLETPRRIAIDTLSRIADDRAMAYYHRSTGKFSQVVDDPERFRLWLKTRAEDFDTIIVEAPAVLVNPYAMIVARAANVVLFAVRWNRTKKEAAREALGQLRASCERSDLRAVLTEVNPRLHERLGLRDTLYFHRKYAVRRAARAS